MSATIEPEPSLQSSLQPSRYQKEAQQLMQAGELDAAIGHLRAGIWNDPHNPHHYATLAECYVRSDRPEAACGSIWEAVSRSVPHNCSEWFYRLHRRLLDRSPARAEQAIAVYASWRNDGDPLRQAVALLGQATIAAHRGEQKQANRWAIEGLEIISERDDNRGWDYHSCPLSGVFDRIGQRCIETQQYQLGADYYEGAIAIQPHNGAFYRNLALMTSEAGDLARSLDCTVHACELNASIYSEMQLESIEIELRGAKHERYADFVEAILEQRPEQALIALKYGQLCLQAGQIERGIRALQTAIAAFHRELKNDRAFVAAYIERTAQLAEDAANRDADLRIARWLQALRVAPQSRDCYREFVDIVLHEKQVRLQGERAQFLGTTRENAKPVGWHETTADYARRAAESGHPVRYIPINDRPDVKLRDPQTLPGLEADLFAEREFRSTPLFVAELTEARLCWGGAIPAAGKNVVATIAHDRHLLADVSVRMPYPTVGFSYPHVRRHWLLNQSLTPPLQRYPGTVANLASIAGRDGTANYYHWVVDLLPRAVMLRDAGFDIDAIDLFLVDNYRSQFQRDSLAALGVPLDRVASISDYPHIQADRTILPSLPGKLATPSHYSVAALRRTIGQQFGKTLAAGAKPTKRLYIRRDRARYRRIFNEAELVARLERYGFTPVRPEALSFAEQVRLFSEAEAIVAPHGAGLTNAVFCQPGTRIVELLAPGYIVPYYWILASLADLDYYYLTGEGMHGSQLRKLIYPNRIEEDVFVDLDRLEALLDRAGLT